MSALLIKLITLLKAFSLILDETEGRVHMSIGTRAHIQGDAGVQVSILGSDIIVQCVKKNFV